MNDPRNTPIKHDAELMRLLSALCDDSITDGEVEKLESILGTDPKARTLYRRYIDMAAELQVRSPESMQPTTAAAIPVYRDGDKPQPKSAIGNRQSAISPRPIPFIIYPIAIAAALLFTAAIVGVYMFVFSTDPQPDPIQPNQPGPPVATLIENTGALRTPADFPVEGESSGAGEYALSTGFAEFMLTNSVNVKLRGDTRMTMHNAGVVTLTRGSASFVVPPNATGFTVRLPDGSRVVDLGTAFVVSVAEDGRPLVYVTQGSVRIDHAAGFSQIFEAGKRVALTPNAFDDAPPLATVITPEMGLRIADYSSQFVGIHQIDRKAAYLIDGSGLTGDKHSTAEGTMWESTGMHPRTQHDPLPAHVTFDLGGSYDLSGIHVWNYNEPDLYKGEPLTGAGAKDVEIWVSPTDNADDLVKLETASGDFVFPMASGTDADPGFDVALDRVANASALRDVRLVRFVILTPHINLGGHQLVGLSEVRFIGSVATPTHDTTETPEENDDHRDPSTNEQ